MKGQPKLTLLGAGPGDPELISLKGINRLKDADVILYDALVNTDLLNYAVHAIKIFVGKQPGHHEKTQAEINMLIVRYAREYGHVIRLKGGDSFVFGRGFEELEYAAKHGLQTEVVPGISSAISVPALFNIPVTMRTVSDSFWVLTGTTSEGGLPDDFELAVKSRATVVILMGLGNLRNIVKRFMNSGKNEMPVAIIEKGSLPQARMITGTIETIIQKSSEYNIKTPATIIIGEVVRQALKMNEIEQFNYQNARITGT